jgi:ferredoxin
MLRKTGLAFSLYPIHEISTTGVLSYSTVPKDNKNIISLLKSISPHKIPYINRLNGHSRGRITIDIHPKAPFSPESISQTKFLFKNLPDALTTLLNIPGLNEIEITGLHKSRWYTADSITFRNSSQYAKREAILLDIVELKRLHDAFIHSSFDNGRFYSLWFSNGTGSCIYAPEIITIRELTQSLPELNGIDLAAFSIYHPVTREQIQSEQQLGYRNTAVCLTKHPWILKPLHGSFIGFPWFRSRLVFAAAPPTSTLPELPPAPCSNCLACASICPSELYPSMLYHYITAHEYEDADKSGAALCIACGNCTAVCPSDIPLAAKLMNYIEQGGTEDE